MLLRSARQRGAARRQKLQLIQISTGQTQRTLFFFQSNPGLPPETLLTLVTLRIAIGDEDFDFLLFRLWCRLHRNARFRIRSGAVYSESIRDANPREPTRIE